MGILVRMREAIKKLKRVGSARYTNQEYRNTNTDSNNVVQLGRSAAESDEAERQDSKTISQFARSACPADEDAPKGSIKIDEIDGRVTERATALNALSDNSNEKDHVITKSSGSKTNSDTVASGVWRSQHGSIGPKYSSVVTIIVGHPEEAFSVHKAIICERSSFFTSALKGAWRERETQTVALPEQEPALFGVYLESTYTSNMQLLAYVRLHADGLVSDGEDKFNRRWKKDQKAMHALIKLYILGDFLGDAKFKDYVIRTIVEGINNNNTLETKDAAPRLVFEGTRSDCGMQKLFADIIASVLVKEPDERAVDRLERNDSSAAVVATMKAMTARRYGDVLLMFLDAEKYFEDS